MARAIGPSRYPAEAKSESSRRAPFYFRLISARRGGLPMVDYYSALLRAVTAPGAGDEDWRRGVYDRARQMLAERLRARHPPATASELVAEQSALEAAIQRVEAE